MNVNILRVVAGLALFSSCSNLGHHEPSTDSMIEHLSATDRGRIDEARAERDRRGDELAAAQQDAARAKAELAVAKKELDVAEARVEQAEASVHVAESGTTAELETARQALLGEQAALVAPQAQISWRKCEIVRRDEAVTVAECKHKLADAHVEAIKARAVGGLQRAGAGSTQVDEHDKRVRDCETQVAMAQVKLDAATRECKLAETAYNESAQPRPRN